MHGPLEPNSQSWHGSYVGIGVGVSVGIGVSVGTCVSVGGTMVLEGTGEDVSKGVGDCTSSTDSGGEISEVGTQPGPNNMAPNISKGTNL